MTLALPDPGDGVAEAIVAAIRERTDLEPVAGIVLGSGLGEAIRVAKEAAGADDGIEIAFTELPGFPPPTVQGHAGKLWIGHLGGRPVAVFQGRIHFYEGHGMPLASITTRVSAGLGARAMMLTTAVGAIDPALRGGSLAVIRDHLNLMGDEPAPRVADARRLARLHRRRRRLRRGAGRRGARRGPGGTPPSPAP